MNKKSTLPQPGVYTNQINTTSYPTSVRPWPVSYPVTTPPYITEYQYECHVCHKTFEETELYSIRTPSGAASVFFCPECFEKVAGKEYVELLRLKEDLIKITYTKATVP